MKRCDGLLVRFFTRASYCYRPLSVNSTGDNSMRTKFALAFFVVLAAAVASAQTLTRYEYPSEGFRASFPSKPELQKQNVPTDAGTFELRAYLVESGESAIFVGICDYGAATSGRDAATILDGAYKGAISNVHAHLVGELRWITLQGNRGVAFEAENDTMHFSARIYYVGTSLYQTLTAAPLKTPYAKNAEFLDSFELIKRTN